jgi:hypothetical protein
MPPNPAIVYPVFALVAWTFVILLRLAYVRFTSRLRFEDFALGESSAVPPRVAQPNRNYMNLLDLPVLFYAACLLLYAHGAFPAVAPVLAWLYVGLRIVHSLVHITYNKVLHRFLAFGISNFVLMAL